jgi:hypothetical protein
VAFSTSGKRGTTLPLVDATAAPLPRSLNVDKSVIMDMLRVLLKHSYVRFGAKLVLQKNGLPMGTQSGPDLANWFGFNYELIFLRALVADITAGAEPSASNARRSCASLTLYARFIDDVLNFNNLQFQQILNVYRLLFPSPLRHRSPRATSASLTWTRASSSLHRRRTR